MSKIKDRRNNAELRKTFSGESLELNELISSAAEQIMILDKDLIIAWANQPLQQAWGTHLVGKKCYEVYHRRKEPCQGCLALKAFQTGKDAQFDTQLLEQQDGPCDFHCTVHVACRDSQGNASAVINICRNLYNYRKAEERLRNSQELAKKFYRKILMMQEEEKKKISRNLHDETGQMAVALSASLNVLEKELQSGQLQNSLRLISESKEIVKKISSKMKSIAVNLRPPALDVLGLAAALREYFSYCTRNHPVKIEFNENTKDVKLDENIQTALYRIVQEAFNNILQHAQASTIKIDLFLKEKQLFLFIEDNGQGFDLDEYKRHYDIGKMGLRGIKERVDILNGTVKLESRLGQGTRLSVILPG